MTGKQITRAELEALYEDRQEKQRLQKENVQLRRRIKQLGRLHAELYEMYKEASKTSLFAEEPQEERQNDNSRNH